MFDASFSVRFNPHETKSYCKGNSFFYFIAFLPTFFCNFAPKFQETHQNYGKRTERFDEKS